MSHLSSISSLKKDNDNDDLITILSDEPNIYNGLYPCINGFDNKLPYSRILLTASYPKNKNIFIVKKIFKKKNSRKTRYQWIITIKYTYNQWKELLNWKKSFTFDIFLTSDKLKKIKKYTLIKHIPIEQREQSLNINNDHFNGIWKSCFNRGAIQSKKISKKGQVILKIMLEDAAFF